VGDGRHKIVNFLAIIVIVFIWLFFWIYARQQFVYVLPFTVLVLLTAAYVNVRKTLFGYVETRKKAKNKPVDPEAERRLRLINYTVIVVIIAVDVFFWIYMRSEFVLALYVMIGVLLIALCINAGKVIADIA
jgi:hypothetical protein